MKEMNPSIKKSFTATYSYDPSYLSAASYHKLLEGSDVIDEEVHEPKFLTEAYQDEKAARVKGDAVCFLLKFLVQVKSTEK